MSCQMIQTPESRVTWKLMKLKSLIEWLPPTSKLKIKNKKMNGLHQQPRINQKKEKMKMASSDAASAFFLKKKKKTNV